MTTRPAAILLLIGALTATACQRPGGDESIQTSSPSTLAGIATTTDPVSASTTTPPTIGLPTTTAPPTTAPSTTDPTSSTAPTDVTTSTTPPTTEPSELTADDLVLIFDGVEPFLFGAAADDVVGGLTDLLGAPGRDDSAEYPEPDDGYFLDEEGEEAYVFPFGRTVCFPGGLCTQFGAGADSALIFTGWTFGGDGAAGLATIDGITIGSLWADHAEVITVEPGGCFQIGSGQAEGVELTLESTGDPFVAVDDEGNLTPQTPDPADVAVIDMSAGELPFVTFADC